EQREGESACRDIRVEGSTSEHAIIRGRFSREGRGGRDYFRVASDSPLATYHSPLVCVAFGRVARQVHVTQSNNDINADLHLLCSRKAAGRARDAALRAP